MNLITDIKWGVELPLKPQLLLYHGATPIIDPIIRWQTDGSVAHAAILWPGMRVSEAVASGVRVRAFGADKEDPKAEIYELPNRPFADWIAAAQFAQNQVGKGYDFLGLIRFLTRGYWGFHRFKHDRKFGEVPNRWFCSDYAFSTIEVAQIRLLETEYFKISPEQLRRSPFKHRVVV